MLIPDLGNAVWRKSSYSGGNGTCVEAATVPIWRRSSYSADNGTCVEVAFAGRGIATRDSKDPDGDVLLFEPAAWRRFLSATAEGAFDRH